jgi:hypothetical protein
MSDEDPFKRRDTRPVLGKTDRRESLRSDLLCRFHFPGQEPRDLMANVSLTGCFLELDLFDKPPPRATALEVEVSIASKRPLRLPVEVAGSPGIRPGVFLAFPELDFDTERSLARLLDTTNFDEHSNRES